MKPLWRIPIILTAIAGAIITDVGNCDACGGLRLRINRVYSSGLEESVQKFLESLGKLNRAYLTALEEKLLNVLKSKIKV
ncbi:MULTISPECIES: hypothetical protein [unclassified Nostoc]|uniref:hypothetical protein n=1 Tax=unclassified Nostoc TaxID=2593658 RepID=UPI002AD46976|nr:MULTISPECIES: hypothetical protein [unclassified Nostoc]MDZ8032096.1 hypothetical protein [Nostoc sp. DedSLP04]MDZ8095887.1 hypothetical protein [Nostoc sp. DedQUE05]